MTASGYFCLSGVATYEPADIPDLLGVPEEIRTMRRALESLGLTEHFPFAEDERPHDALEEALANPLPDAETLVIYCTGHGLERSTPYRLPLPRRKRCD